MNFLNVNRMSVNKGWGREQWVDDLGKILHMDAGKRTSWHYHPKKEETLLLVSGSVAVRWLSPAQVVELEFCGWTKEEMLSAFLSNFTVLAPGDSFRVPVGMLHQLIAVSTVQVVEFSPEHMDENSIRIVKGD